MIKLQEVLNARRLALEILIQYEKDKSYINLNFKNNVRLLNDRRERALCREITYSVIENQIYIDFIISMLSSVKLKKLSLQVKSILRCGIAQIKFMDKIPSSAAVNESVKLAKIYCRKSYAFVNAVLRNYLRKRSEIEDIIDNMDNALLIKNSLPQHIFNVFSESYGYEKAVKICQNINKKNHNYIYINNLKISTEDFIKQAEKNKIFQIISQNNNICKIKLMDDVQKDVMFINGFYHFQSVPSALTCRLLAPKENDIVIDMCAAPGGKSFTMAEMMKNKGKLYSFDIYEHKINLMKIGTERLGIDIITPELCDASLLNEKYINVADKVLCDVPCSGLGIIFKKPDIKYKDISKIEELPALQKKILSCGAKYCKAGGELVYSTCTLNINENEKVINDFLKENSNFEIVNTKLEYNGIQITDEKGFNTFMPYIEGFDGFFNVKLKRMK